MQGSRSLQGSESMDPPWSSKRPTIPETCAIIARLVPKASSPPSDPLGIPRSSGQPAAKDRTSRLARVAAPSRRHRAFGV